MTLLTIAIPTFNRAEYLNRLLRELEGMLSDRTSGTVELIVSDNASEDGTAAVVADFVLRYPGTRTIRNPSNVGADANIEQCFRLARGEYVWILGDDDMPKSGAINALLTMLSTHRPDLVFLPSEWRPDVYDPRQGTEYDPNGYEILGQLEFARRVNVWLTFLSGIVVRKSHAANADFTSLYQSHLLQMGWILPALRDGSSFCAFRDPLILATAGNTGGYAVIKVFGGNFSSLVAGVFGQGSAVYRAVIGRTVSGYLPQLIWNVRTARDGRFEVELPLADLRREIGRFVAFWCFVLPIAGAPRPIARGALLVSRIVAKLSRTLRG